MTALILDREKTNSFKDFTGIRELFETILIDSDNYVQQIVRKYRSSINSYEHVKSFYLLILKKAWEGKLSPQIIEEVLQDQNFNYLRKPADSNIDVTSKDFSKDTKSAIFIKEALANPLRCKICRGLIHLNSISFDHIIKKSDGGIGDIDNGQISHPYCNTTYKN